MFLLPLMLVYKTMRLAFKGAVTLVTTVRHHAPAWRSMAEPRVIKPAEKKEAPSIPEEVNEEDSATFHTRPGDGFKVVFHLRVESHRVQPVVWFDFKRLAERLGQEVAEDMQARLGQLPTYALASGRRPHWGRLQLPEVSLHVRSSREAHARTYMLDTLDAVERMIEEGGRDLVSGHWASLPKGDPEVLPVRQQTLPLPEESGASDTPPKKTRPDVVCIGYLVETGFTERKEAASGRTYKVFFADIDLGGGRRCRQTGSDLERALREAEAEPGEKVRLEQFGTVPVNGGRFRRKVWEARVLQD